MPHPPAKILAHDRGLEQAEGALMDARRALSVAAATPEAKSAAAGASSSVAISASACS